MSNSPTNSSVANIPSVIEKIDFNIADYTPLPPTHSMSVRFFLTPAPGFDTSKISLIGVISPTDKNGNTSSWNIPKEQIDNNEGFLSVCIMIQYGCDSINIGTYKVIVLYEDKRVSYNVNVYARNDSTLKDYCYAHKTHKEPTAYIPPTVDSIITFNDSSRIYFQNNDTLIARRVNVELCNDTASFVDRKIFRFSGEFKKGSNYVAFVNDKSYPYFLLGMFSKVVAREDSDYEAVTAIMLNK
ncbi:MAG: hypothetical protein JNL74_17875 [Fibrobacteres bacterium]|nr:hypothetical protein [Fibrobacterota bacterium]